MRNQLHIINFEFKFLVTVGNQLPLTLNWQIKMSLIVRQVLDIFPAILLGFIGDKYTMNVSFEEIIGQL